MRISSGTCADVSLDTTIINVIASGTASELKSATGGARLEVTLTKQHGGAVAALAPLVDGPIDVSADGRLLRAAVPTGSGFATKVIRALDTANILVDDVAVHPPSLDDVFFALTGSPAVEAEPTPDSELEVVA